MKRPSFAKKPGLERPIAQESTLKIEQLPLKRYTALAISVYRNEPAQPMPIPHEYASVPLNTIEESALLTLAWMAAYPKSFTEGVVFVDSNKDLLIWELYSRPHPPAASPYVTESMRIMEHFGLASNGCILFGACDAHSDTITWCNPVNDRFIDSILHINIMQSLEKKRMGIARLLKEAPSIEP